MSDGPYGAACKNKKHHKFVLSVSVYYLKSKMYNKMIMFIIKEEHGVLKLSVWVETNAEG